MDGREGGWEEERIMGGRRRGGERMRERGKRQLFTIDNKRYFEDAI